MVAAIPAKTKDAGSLAAPASLLMLFPRHLSSRFFVSPEKTQFKTSAGLRNERGPRRWVSNGGLRRDEFPHGTAWRILTGQGAVHAATPQLGPALGPTEKVGTRRRKSLSDHLPPRLSDASNATAFIRIICRQPLARTWLTWLSIWAVGRQVT